MIHFGKNLRYYRRKRRLSQVELAKKMNVKSDTTISNWEQGISSPNVHMLVKLVTELDVDINKLVYGDHE